MLIICYSNPSLYDANNHQPKCTPSTFPNHPQPKSVHEVPFQAVHIPILYTRHWPQPNSYSEHLSKPSTIPIHTRGTFPSRPQAHAVHRVPTVAYSILWAPFKLNHHPNPYIRYIAKLSTIPTVHRVPGQTTIGQLTSRRMEDHN
jgi:hypothetical protein